MKLLILSMLCMVSFSNSYLAMNKPSLPSKDNLTDWEIPNNEEIQAIEKIQDSSNQKQTLSWFPIINAVKRSLHKQQATSMPLPTATTTDQNSLNSIPASQQQNKEFTPLVTITNIAPLKKNPSHENLYNIHEILTITSAVIDDAKLNQQNTSTTISPLRSNHTSYTNLQENISQNQNQNFNNVTNDFDNMPLSSMQIDRNSKDAHSNDSQQPALSLLTMLHQNCCNCFDLSFYLDNNKKKRNKS